jgi:hypothetical protein
MYKVLGAIPIKELSFFLIFAISSFFLISNTKAESLTFEHIIVDSTDLAYVRVVGDVDGDGYPDIIAVNDSGLRWYKYPSWSKYTIKEFNWRADDIEIGDIDNDGDIDVVGIQDDDGKVYWFENPRPSGNPTGTWTSHYIGTNGAYVKDMEIADFNKDGKLDVVTRTHTTTSIFTQVSSTSWTKVKTLSHGGVDGLDVGDLDMDGDPDIVLNGFWFETPADLTSTWARYNIDSKWWNQSGGDYTWRNNNAKVFVTDVNGDSRPDVLITQSELPGYPVSWYEAADPKNGPWVEHIMGSCDYCHTLQAGDIDNDGDIDVVVGKFERDAAPYIPSPFPLRVFYNKNGDGLSWNVQEIDTLGIYSGVIGDISNDGDLDIVGSRSYWKGPVEIRENKRSDNKLPLNQWTYIQVDNNMPARVDYPNGPAYFFGLATGDINGDGYKDIVAHKFFYKNPGGNMQEKWQRINFPWDWTDAFAIVNVDDDQYGDVIAEGEEVSGNINIYWLEAQDIAGNSWKRVLIGSIPKTEHLWSQSYEVAQIVPGGKPEILIGGGDGVYYFNIPSNPASGNWPKVKIINNGYGYATGDINGDGYLDVAGAYDSINVAWWKNPGNGAGSWTRYTIGQIIYEHADRFAIADINRDGRKDIIVSEEVYPIDEQRTHCFWFEAKTNPESGSWTRHTILDNTWSLNSMSATDMDRDGDVDVVSGEMGNLQRLMISENEKGNFGSPIVVDTDKESHLGARVADLDSDGDPDIISIGWNEYQYLHVWRNDAGATPTCTRANPSVSINPSSQSTTAGSTLSYTVSVKNNDNSVCGSSTFDLSVTSCPSGFTCTLSKNSVTISPGSTDSSTNISVKSSPTTPTGTYTFTVRATNSAATSYYGSGSATYVVTVPTVCSQLNYPSDKWQRVWYVHSTSSCLGNGPDETSLTFDNNWGTGTIAYSKSDDIEFFSSRTINIQTTGTYTFTVGSDDGIRLWVDDVLRIDKWVDRAYTTDSVDVALTAGNHKIRIDWYENSGAARVYFMYNQHSGSIDLKKGWNLISIPVNSTLDKSSIVCDIYKDYIYSYDSLSQSYKPVSFLEPGKGYWVYAKNDCSFSITGSPYSLNTSLKSGWNIVGSSSSSTSSLTGCNIISSIWYYDPTIEQYTKSSTIEPGKAYWLKVSSDCTLTSK